MDASSPGTVRTETRISRSSNTGFTGLLSSNAHFNSAVALLGDTVLDLAVGASGMNSVFVVFMRYSGTVTGQQLLSSSGGLSDIVAFPSNTLFGASVCRRGKP